MLLPSSIAFMTLITAAKDTILTLTLSSILSSSVKKTIKGFMLIKDFTGMTFKKGKLFRLIFTARKLR